VIDTNHAYVNRFKLFKKVFVTQRGTQKPHFTSKNHMIQ